MSTEDAATLQDQQDDEKCLVCKSNPIEYATVPCNHAYLCKRDGMKQGTGGKCKICREFFVELKKIHK